MATMILRFQDGGAQRWGRLLSDAPERPDDEIEVVALEIEAATTGGFLAALAAEPGLGDRGDARRIRGEALLSPITSDATLLCQGLNYREHAAEAGHHMRKANLLFGKASSSLTGPYADVVRPRGVELLDYELEVGVVLRRDLGPHTVVDAANVGDYVAGVVLCNDVSARDVMFGASFMQWYQGKSYHGFCPAGPVLYLLSPDEVGGTLEELEIGLWFNGEQKQSAVSSQLIYKPAETLTQIAAIQTLKRGDMVLTGTPGGVIAQGTSKLIEILKTQLLADEQRRDAMREEMKTLGAFLQPGDELVLRMRDGKAGCDLGAQRTRIADA